MNEAAIAYVLRRHLDPFPFPDYRVIRSENDLWDYCSYIIPAEPENPIYGSDTESLPDGSPYCFTFSHTPGTGRLIYATDTKLIKAFNAEINIFGLASEEEVIPLIFHNFLHDANPCDVLGIHYGPIHDTMVRAYNLCLGGGGDDEDESRAGRGSLGLKTLAYRLLNMHMTSFKDTVTPHSLPHAMNWLEQAEALFKKPEWVPICICGCPVDLHQIRGVKRPAHSGPCSNCNCPKCKRAKKPATTEEDKQFDSVYTKVTNLMMALLIDEKGKDGAPIDPWKRVKDWEESYPLVVDVLGPLPPRSVAHVPEPELVHYACRDADADLRLHLFLKTYIPWVYYS